MEQQISIGTGAQPGESASGGHQCACGCADDTVPTLEARSIPKPIRHGAIFGALGSLQRGASMILVAPHDPLPLLAQLEERMPGAFAVEYVERCDDCVKVQFTRS